MRTSKEEMSWQEKRNADGEGEVSRDQSGLVGLTNALQLL